MTSELTERLSPAPGGSGSTGELPVEAVTAAVEPVRPDHVRSHSVRCYWDFVECRWQCSRD